MKKLIITAITVAGLSLAQFVQADDQNAAQSAGQQIGSGIQQAGQTIQQAAGASTETPTEINKASKLISMKVVNQRDEKLGTVKDVILDNKAQRVAYLWIKKTNEEGSSGKYVAVPINVFTSSSDQKNLVLNADKQKFESAQGYASDEQLPTFSQTTSQASFWQSISEPAGAQQPYKK